MASPPRSQSPERLDTSGNKIRKFNNGWTHEQEQLMAGWADISACYRWMHNRCEKKATFNNLCMTVPVIVLSTLTGSASFIMTGLLGNNEKAQGYAQIGIGSVSIFTGILTTLGNFFRYAQSSEANRVSSIAWGKFQRQIALELALHPKERIDSMDFLKLCRAELDRLIEQSPQIPASVILEFEKEFFDTPLLKKPDIAHGLEHTRIFKDTKNMHKVAVDAAIMLKQRRRVLHDAIPEVDRRIDEKLRKFESLLKPQVQRGRSRSISVIDIDSYFGPDPARDLHPLPPQGPPPPITIPKHVSGDSQIEYPEEYVEYPIKN